MLYFYRATSNAEKKECRSGEIKEILPHFVEVNIGRKGISFNYVGRNKIINLKALKSLGRKTKSWKSEMYDNFREYFDGFRAVGLKINTSEFLSNIRSIVENV